LQQLFAEAVQLQRFQLLFQGEPVIGGQAVAAGFLGEQSQDLVGIGRGFGAEMEGDFFAAQLQAQNPVTLQEQFQPF